EEIAEPFAALVGVLAFFAEVPHGVLQVSQVAQALDGEAPGFLGGMARGLELPSPHVHMKRHFGVHLFGDARLEEQGAELPSESSQACHGFPSQAVCMTRV